VAHMELSHWRRANGGDDSSARVAQTASAGEQPSRLNLWRRVRSEVDSRLPSTHMLGTLPTMCLFTTAHLFSIDAKPT
jgi:hypothetical protein